MSIIIEDGTAKIDSEVYCTVAFADTYHAARGNDAWDNVDNKEAALRKAADYIGQMYRTKWAGTRVSDLQAMDWPRYNVPRIDSAGSYYPSNSVPLEIQKANAEFALKTVDGDLLADTDTPVIEETVGPITTRYAAGASQAKKFPAVERLLAPFISGGVGSIRLVRA
jgi:hypothetical protein